MNFMNHVLEPLLKIAREHKGDIRSLIGNSELYRNLFAEWFDKGEMKLEDLPQQKKVELWEESKQFCPAHRLEWCKAVTFYKSFQ